AFTEAVLAETAGTVARDLGLPGGTLLLIRRDLSVVGGVGRQVRQAVRRRCRTRARARTRGSCTGTRGGLSSGGEQSLLSARLDVRGLPLLQVVGDRPEPARVPHLLADEVLTDDALVLAR